MITFTVLWCKRCRKVICVPELGGNTYNPVCDAEGGGNHDLESRTAEIKS